MIEHSLSLLASARKTLRLLVVLASAFAAMGVPSARAVEIRILATQAMTDALPELAALLERTTGDRVVATFGTTGALAARVERGEGFDLVILARSALDRLIDRAQVTPTCAGFRGEGPGSRCAVDVIRARVALAVASGMPRPDIGTPDALRRFLLSSRGIAFPDPADGGASGVAMARAIELLGIEDAVRARLVLARNGASTGEIVLSGRADVAVQMHSELAVVPGITVVGPLPDSLSPPLVFAAGLGKDARETGGARTFVALLRTPEAAAILARFGLQPL